MNTSESCDLTQPRPLKKFVMRVLCRLAVRAMGHGLVGIGSVVPPQGRNHNKSICHPWKLGIFLENHLQDGRGIC